MEKFNIFDQNDGLTSLQKFKFGDYTKSIFLWSRKTSFLFKIYLNILLGLFCLKQTMKEFNICDQNLGLTPFKNSNLATL